MSEPPDPLRAEEAEALFKIHGVDQRSPTLEYAHPALGARPLVLRQDGSTSAAFTPGTSTVIWPCAFTLGDFLCDATAAYRAANPGETPDAADAASHGAIVPSTVAVELGAGLGLAGLVAARLGAERVAITDATPLAARRNLDASGCANATVDELWWARAGWRRGRGPRPPRRGGPKSGRDAGDGGDDDGEPSSSNASDSDSEPAEPEDAATAEEAAGALLATLPRGAAPHVILGSDVCYSQGRREMQMLADTMAALMAPSRTVAYVVFEDRGDGCWGTLNKFWCAAEEAGLEGDPTPIEDVEIGGKKREGEGRHNDSERLLLRLTKRA